MEAKELKLTFIAQLKAAENFPISIRSRYTLFYGDKIYKAKESILDCSDYLSNYFESNCNINELKLKFKYATSVQALDVVMKLLFGLKDVLIPNEEYIQVLAFLEELSNLLTNTTLIIIRGE